LTSADPAATERARKRVITAGIREVAQWLGDTPTVARSSYVDPGLISRYEADGELPGIPALRPGLPTSPEAEAAVAALLATPPK
jgi:DNA topoisomerase I